MSYGKEAGQTDKIAGNMNRQMQRAAQRTSSRGGRSPLWLTEFRPSEVMVDKVRLIPVNYSVQRVAENGGVYSDTVPWWECTQHYHGGLKKQTICSGGVFRNVKGKTEPCVGCEMFWSDWAERKDIEARTGHKVKNPNRVSKSDRYVFHVIDMGYFFRGPDLDDKGIPRTDDKGTPYTKWLKYDGSPLHQQLLGQVTKNEDKRWGRLLEWSMGHDTFTLFTEYADKLGHNCASCGGQNSIKVAQWLCEQCRNPLFDPQQLMVPLAQLNDLTNRPNMCRHCQHTGYPHEIIGCTNCAAPRRASIFDVEFDVSARKDPDTNQRTLAIQGISAPCLLRAEFTDLLEKIPNLAEKYAPISYGDQMTLFQQNGAREPAPTAAQPGMPPAPPGAGVPAPMYGHAAPVGHAPHPAMSPAPAQAPVAPPVYATPYMQPAPVYPNAAPGMQPTVAIPPVAAPQGGWSNGGGWGSGGQTQ